MTPIVSFLDELKLAADRATAAEDEFRRSIVERTKLLDRERAFAFRRFNLMRAVVDAVAAADSEEIAVASAMAVLRAKLGWASDSEARVAVFSRFAPVAQAAFAALSLPAAATPQSDVGNALSAFEIWYQETHPGPFWMLFETYLPETPRVDF